MVTTQEPRTAVAHDPTERFRRLSTAIALPLAFVFQLACNVIYAVISTESGIVNTENLADDLALSATYPTQMIAMSTLAMIGCLLTIPGALAGMRVLRPAQPRLSLWAGILLILGYVAYFGIVFGGLDSLAVSLSLADPVSAYVNDPAGPIALAVGLMFAIGNLLGALLLGLAIVLAARRDPALGIPWWAGVLVMSWTVLHIINFTGGGEWFAVAGGVLQIIGLSFVARAAARPRRGGGA